MSAVRPLPAAIAASSSSSGSDSTLTQRMPSIDRERELARGLADAGEHDLVRRNPGGARAQQLAFGDDIGAGAELGQRRDHRLVGIRLHGVADQRIDIGEGAGEHLVVPLDGRARIAIERRADGVRQRDEIDRFGVQHAVAIGEVVHGSVFSAEKLAGFA